MSVMYRAFALEKGMVPTPVFLAGEFHGLQRVAKSQTPLSNTYTHACAHTYTHIHTHTPGLCKVT